MSENIELKKSIYQALKDGTLDDAENMTLSAMEEDIHNPDYEKILKIVKFWQNRKDLFQFKDNNGERLFEEWDKFLEFCRANRIDTKKALLSVKSYIYSRIIDLLIDSYKLSPVPERETLIVLGQSFYEIGLVDKAIETLEFAMSLSASEDDVRIYTMLGNLYHETGDSDLSMVMYNEAFLKYPQLINLETIDYQAIHKLKQMIVEDGFKDHEVLEWIPIYGYIYEGLTTKRKLEYKDYVDLKEKAIDYEKSLTLDKKVIHIIIPRLMNYYLWIMDYYLFQVNAYGPAKNVARRVLELFGLVELPSVREKLTGRAGLLFKKLIENKTEDKLTTS